MSRTKILTKIKKAAKRKRKTNYSELSPNDRLFDHPRNLVPKRSRLEQKDRMNLFVNEAKKVQAEVSILDDFESIPKKVCQIIKSKKQKPEIRYSPALSILPWSSVSLRSSAGKGKSNQGTTVTLAFAGVAETGTLVLLSGPENPTTLSFLPLLNIVVLESEKIFGSYEDVWEKIRYLGPSDGKGNQVLPRTINLITGPSRTADIEQTLLLGIHGPQELCVLIVKKP